MERNTRIFSIIKLCLVILVMVLAVGLSVFSSGGDRNIQYTSDTTEDVNHTIPDETTEDVNHTIPDETAEDVKDAVSGEKTAPSEIVGSVVLYGKNIREDAVVQNIMKDMTVSDKVGQLFFLCVKTRFDESLLDTYKVGGILLFGNDVRGESRESLTDKVNRFQENSEIPLLVGIDEEGGSVSRLNNNSRLIDYVFESPRTLYAKGGMDAICEDTENKCFLLKSYGINVNFAPVCDISQNPGDYMYSRSLGATPEITADYITAVVGIMNADKVGAVLKHFPGYGSNGDTHKNVVKDSRTYEELSSRDFLPFSAGIDAGAGCVLVSHNVVECMDEEAPASLSLEVHRVLREELGFNGVIITDDLSMDGVLTFTDNNEAVVQAVLAGNDMLIATYYKEQYEAVLNAVNKGTISEDRLNESVERILRWKYSLGLF